METWSIDEFITYLYQIVADADLETTQSEMDAVKMRAEKILSEHFSISNYSYQNSLKKIQQTETNLLNFKEIIKSGLKKFEFSQEVKSIIIVDLNAIAASDQCISPGEKETISFLNQLFMMVEMPLSW